MRTPVALLIFNRPDVTAKVFAQISSVRPPILLIAADGPRPQSPDEQRRCAEARAVTENVDWPCKVFRRYSDSNLGCRLGVATALDWVFECAEEAIIIEDDCLPAARFFQFCDEMLERYRGADQVMHVNGCKVFPGRLDSRHSYFFSRYPSVWGWATWRRAWRHYDVDMTQWRNQDERAALERRLRSHSSFDFRRLRQLWDDTCAGRIDTWDYQWTFSCIRRNAACVTPWANLVTNLGFNQDATHTRHDRSPLGRLQLEDLDDQVRHPEAVAFNDRADNLVAAAFHYRRPHMIRRMASRLLRPLGSLSSPARVLLPRA